MGTVNQGRPVPLHGQMEEVAFAVKLCIRRVTADGVVTDDETREVINLADVLADRACEVAERDAATIALLAGRDGLNSNRFRERVTTAWKANLIEMFPEDPEPEPFDQRAA